MLCSRRSRKSGATADGKRVSYAIAHATSDCRLNWVLYNLILWSLMVEPGKRGRPALARATAHALTMERHRYLKIETLTAGATRDDL